MMISVFGSTGFIGSRFCEMFPDDAIHIPRDVVNPQSNDVLYLISTTHNYNPLPVDVYTNLYVLSDTLQHLTPDNVFNFISSWFVYGNCELPAKEGNEGLPLGNYSFTKRLAELLVMAHCQREKIPYRIFRLANVFGKGDKFSKKKNALQYLINEMRHDRPISLYYGGEFFRNYIHVDAVCDALMQGMEILPTNEIYNVGSSFSARFRDLLIVAKRILDSESEIRSIEPSEFHNKVGVKNFYMDTTKIRDHGVKINSSPYKDLEDMILDET